MPTNLYGPRDNFHLETFQELPALIRKMHLGKALEENDWEAVHDDLNRRPNEGIYGIQGKKEILETLYYGIVFKEKPSKNIKEQGQVLIEILGSDQPLMEFLWSEEMQDSCVFLMENRDFKDIVTLLESPGVKEVRNTHTNIGTGKDIYCPSC